MRLVKYRPLDVADHVAIFTHHLREGDFPDLGKLRFAELEIGVIVLVPESVALFELLESEDIISRWGPMPKLESSKEAILINKAPGNGKRVEQNLKL